MIDVLKEILLDGLERQPFFGVNRRVDFTALPGKATVCMGVRRSGNSTFMHQWMEDCYFLFSVRLFDASLNRSNANPKKIYCVDHAMVRSISSGILTSSGHLLENMVFASMRREGGEIFYYRTKSGKEVDFIRLRDRSRRQLVQVCETLVDSRTRKRELAALVEAMTECGLSEGVIVTRSESETLETPAGTVRVVPAWTFLLE